MTDLECSEGGCSTTPDTNRCPNCANKHDVPPTKSQAKSNDTGITVSCIGFAPTCSMHGKIYVRASVASDR